MYLACYYSVRAIDGSVELKQFIITEPVCEDRHIQGEYILKYSSLTVTAYYIC